MPHWQVCSRSALLLRVNGFTAAYQLILVGCDGDEDGLGEDEGFELLGLQCLDRRAVLALDDVHTWLVLVHRVQDYLQTSQIHIYVNK